VLVYGDQPRREDPLAKLAAIEAALGAGKRTEALIEAGELAQGLADAEFEALGFDDDTPLQIAAMELCIAAAAGRDVAGEAAALRALPLPGEVSVKTPEGYAFYALYPESYAKAAAAYGWSGPPFVIGLRSIGTSLAAAVAAATGASDVITVRPTGDPFRRELRLSPALRARLAAHEGPFAIVDEGPGLSGSSFGSAADALEALGVAPERIVFLPGHRGDLGPEARPEHRARWARSTRLVADADVQPEKLFADLTGALREAEDVGGSVWKVRLAAERGDFVARFAGLGAYGETKFARAAALHAAGFGPKPAALRRGLLLQRWAEGRPALPSLEHLARYLRFRREAFPAAQGASAESMIEMARVNVGKLLGEDAGRAAADRLRQLPLGEARPRPVHVDARLHREKWLSTDRGVVKLDALDHSQAHDLVGPQDIAWDVAGAARELGLSAGEQDRLAKDVGADPVMLRLFQVCYPAFQAGLATFRGEDPSRYRDDLARMTTLTESAN